MTDIDFTMGARRQYVFRSRRCRQRIAQRLGGGRAVGEVAGIERLHEGEIERLLGDPGFAELVRYYRDQAALPPDRRLAALAEFAMAMLERLVGCGDLRAITFVLHETGRGRDPARRLAEAAIAAANQPSPQPSPASGRGSERCATQRAAGKLGLVVPSPPGEGADGAFTSLHPDVLPQAGEEIEGAFVPPLPHERERVGVRASDDQPTGNDPGPRRGRRSRPYAFCAAVQPDEATARLLAEEELALVERRLAAAIRGLRGQLTAEAEREGTSRRDADRSLSAAADRLAMLAFATPEAGFRAAARLEAHRRHLAEGGVPLAAAPGPPVDPRARPPP